jgi:hypothetical protein
MSPGLHGELARAAEQNGTSLNGYIIACLAESVGSTGDDVTPRAAPDDRQLRRVTLLLLANVVAVALAGLAALVILLVAL